MQTEPSGGPYSTADSRPGMPDQRDSVVAVRGNARADVSKRSAVITLVVAICCAFLTVSCFAQKSAAPRPEAGADVPVSGAPAGQPTRSRDAAVVNDQVEGERRGLSLPRLQPQMRLNDQVKDVAFSSDGRIAALVGSGGVSLWNTTSGRVFRQIGFSGSGWSQTVDLAQDGNRVLTTVDDGGVLLDVATGERIQTFRADGELSPVGGGVVTDDGRVLLCGGLSLLYTGLGCNVAGLRPEADPDILFPDPFLEGVGGTTVRYVEVSVAHDESALVARRSDGSAEWMPWGHNGRRRDIPLSGGRISAVEALGGTHVVVGFADGRVGVVDMERGVFEYTLDTEAAAVSAVARLDDEHLVAAVFDIGEGTYGDWGVSGSELLVLAQEDLSVVRRVRLDGGVVRRLVASADGRMLATVVSSFEQFWGGGPRLAIRDYFEREDVSVGGGDTVALWSTATWESRVLGSPVLRTARLQWGGANGEWLLVNGFGPTGSLEATLWDFEQGSVVERFSGGATIIGSGVGYGGRHWSIRAGHRDMEGWEGPLLDGEEPSVVGADSRGATLASAMLYAEAGRLRVFSLEGGLVRLSTDVGVELGVTLADASGKLYGDVNRLLLYDYTAGSDGTSGVELLNTSSGKTLWYRDDLLPFGVGWFGDAWLTADSRGVVVSVAEEQSGMLGWLVLDAESGEVRFWVADRGPFAEEDTRIGDYWTRMGWDVTYDGREGGDTVVAIVGDEGKSVRGFLVSRGRGRVEWLSAVDGNVLYSAQIPIERVSAAVSLGDDRVFVAGDGENAIVWDVAAEEVSGRFEWGGVGVPLVAFSRGRELMAVGAWQGGVGLWDLQDGARRLRRLGTLIALEGGDWAVVGQDGRYDASDPGEFGGLGWVVREAPTEVTSVASFFARYYEPRLLPRLLEGEAFPEIASVADVDLRTPQVEVVDVQGDGVGRAVVKVEVRRAGARRVGEVKLFRDGRLVATRQATGGGRDEDDAWVVEFRDVALPTSGVGEVEFSAYVFNGDAVKSDTHRTTHRLGREVSGGRGSAFVVVVGVNAYENASWDLRYAANDARLGAEVVGERLRASGRFEAVYTATLTSERGESGAIVSTATRKAFLGVLDLLGGRRVERERLNGVVGVEGFRKVTPDDLVYLSFSGHGLSGADGRFHFFLSDVGGGARRIVDEELLGRTLDSDVLAERVRGLDAGQFVLVIDACNSAASVEGEGFKPGPMGNRGLGQMAYDKGMYVVAAAQAEAVALESDRLEHGLLTYAMLREGLEEGGADRAPVDGVVSFRELLGYGAERVPRLHEEIVDGAWTADGRALVAAVPIEDDGAVVIQRPRFFDFGGGGEEVLLPWTVGRE